MEEDDFGTGENLAHHFPSSPPSLSSFFIISEAKATTPFVAAAVLSATTGQHSGSNYIPVHPVLGLPRQFVTENKIRCVPLYIFLDVLSRRIQNRAARVLQFPRQVVVENQKSEKISIFPRF